MQNLAVVNRLPTQRMTSLLEQRSSEAKALLSKPATPTEASKAAKQLVGSFANLRPDQPDVFIASIAAALAAYPLGLVQECADPRRGLARKVEFMSVKSLTEWCDDRMKFYETLASYQQRPQIAARPELTVDERAKGLAAWLGLQKTLDEHGTEAARALTFEKAAEIGAAAVERKPTEAAE